MSTQVHANNSSKQNFIGKLNKKKLVGSERMVLIGKKLRVVNSKNPMLIGKKGTIIDETKNMLRVQENKKNYALIKDQVTLEICGTRIEGADIVKQTSERIKVKK